MTASAGFAPLAGAGARVLILGSLPSQQSLQSREYYGNPRNAFWRIMGDLLKAGPGLSYRQRCELLVKNGIAVWDVLQTSVRPGSLDANIDMNTVVANDFASFYAQQADLSLVCFNGQKSASLYKQLVMRRLSDKLLHLRYVSLPSTSPAFAAMNYAGKLQRWSIIKGDLHVP